MNNLQEMEIISAVRITGSRIKNHFKIWGRPFMYDFIPETYSWFHFDMPGNDINQSTEIMTHTIFCMISSQFVIDRSPSSTSLKKETHFKGGRELCLIFFTHFGNIDIPLSFLLERARGGLQLEERIMGFLF